MELGPKDIGYFLRLDYWVDCLLMELCPRNLGYFLEPNYFVDYVIGFDWNYKVCFLPTKVGSKNIGYFLKPDHSIAD